MKALQELREMIAEKKAGEQDMRVFLVNLIKCISCQYYQMYFLTIIQCISLILSDVILQHYQMYFLSILQNVFLINIIKCFFCQSYFKHFIILIKCFSSNQICHISLQQLDFLRVGLTLFALSI